MRQFEKVLLGFTKTATRAYTIREATYSTPSYIFLRRHFYHLVKSRLREFPSLTIVKGDPVSNKVNFQGHIDQVPAALCHRLRWSLLLLVSQRRLAAAQGKDHFGDAGHQYCPNQKADHQAQKLLTQWTLELGTLRLPRAELMSTVMCVIDPATLSSSSS